MIKLFNSFSIGGLKLTMGIGAIDTIAKEICTAGLKKPLIVTDRGIEQAGILANIQHVLESGGIPYDIYADVASDPSSVFVEEGLQVLTASHCDCVIGLGGGSAMAVSYTHLLQNVNIISSNTAAADGYGDNIIFTDSEKA